MSQSLDGNTADVTRYIPIWRDINNLMGSFDFLTVGDCKLSSEDNLLTIAKGDGYFLAPLAMYSNLEEELREYVLSNGISPIKLDERKKDNKLITYHGFEVPAFIEDPKTGKKYHYRKIFVKSSQLEETKSKTLDKKLTKSIEEIEKVEGKLNRYKSVNTKEKIEAAIESILNENKVNGLINYQIDEKTTITKKQVGHGQPAPNTVPNTVYEEIEVKEHSLSYSFNKQAIEEEKKLCGYFVLCTNKPENELSMKQDWFLTNKLY